MRHTSEIVVVREVLDEPVSDLSGAPPPGPAFLLLTPPSTERKRLQKHVAHGDSAMTTTQIFAAVVALLAAAQTCASGELLHPGADSTRALMGAPLTGRADDAPAPSAAKEPKPAGRATIALPENREAAATAPDALDQDSDFRITHRQQLELAGIFAFGAGVSIVMLIQASVEFMRSAIRCLDETLTSLYGDPNRARRVPGQTQVTEGGAGASARDHE
jgi:hypothetical protein